MDKSELRKFIIKKRDTLSSEEILQNSRYIFEKLVCLPEYEKAKNILVYASFKSEVRTDEIILDCLAQGKNVFCPKVTDRANSKMEFVRIYEIEDLEIGYYGIREPSLNEDSLIYRCDSFNDSESLVIVPGVAFDEEGNRIGYNGGFYDRFLSEHPDINTVALAFSVQIIDEVPAQLHDMRVNRVLSE